MKDNDFSHEERIAYALETIASVLLRMEEISNPLLRVGADTFPEDTSERAFYTDEKEEIIREHLARIGKEYKPNARF